MKKTQRKGTKQMEYKALYRVWRPRTFADVVGQQHITQTLQNALSSGKFSHAYLFSGPRGTGKTSAAKIFAQTINCEQMPTREPCNECDACRGIRDGSIPDVIEIDAASNTSVDDIREIRDKVKYAPSAVPYKVYIIDEVHMISVNAFNALLKTLEEPPAHVVFILATTEPHKVPLTIISRCQRFDFKPISNQTIVERMKYIMSEENYPITDEALEAIALNAEGGMRDALSILDQAISYSDGEVTVDDVLAVTGGVSQDILVDITKALYRQETSALMEHFDALIQNGKDPKRFVFDMIYFIRDLLFYQTTPELSDHLERAVLTESFQALAEEVNPEWLQQVIRQLTETEQQLKWTTSPKVFVEVALITIANRNLQPSGQTENQAVNNEAVNELKRKINELEQKINALTHSLPQSQPERATPARREGVRPKRKGFDVQHETIYRILDVAEKAPLQQLRSYWPTFLQQVKQVNLPAHATIQDSKPVAASKDTAIVAFKYDIHCSLFMEHKAVIESVLTNGLAPFQIVPIPEDEWLKIRTQYVQQRGESEKQQVQEEHVTKALDLFGNEIVEIRE